MYEFFDSTSPFVKGLYELVYECLIYEKLGQSFHQIAHKIPPSVTAKTLGATIL